MSEISDGFQNIKVYNNCFKFSCEQFKNLNDSIVKNVEVYGAYHHREIKVLISPLLKSNIFNVISILIECPSVNIKIELTDESGNVIAEALNGAFDLIEYKYVLSHTRICSDNQPLFIELQFKEV